MRRLLIGFCCALILAGLAGCGETATTAEQPSTTVETTSDSESEPRDGESLIEEIVAKIKDVFD